MASWTRASEPGTLFRKTPISLPRSTGSSSQAASSVSASSRIPGSVDEARGGSDAGRPASTAIDDREELRGAEGLGQEIVHAGREAALAIFLHRVCRQGDDGQVSPRGSAPARE